MSLSDCVLKKINAGKLSPSQGRQVLDLVGKLEQENRRLGPEGAKAAAATETLRILTDEAKRQRRIANLKVLATARILKDMANHPKGAATAAISHLVRDLGDKAPWQNVDFLKRQILGLLHAKWADGIDAMRPTLLGLNRKKTLQSRILQELFGEDSGDDLAKQSAKAWNDAAEYGRQRFNRAGGAIAKRADWGLPQMHDPRLVSKVSKQDWIDFVMPRLNRAKITDALTGAPMDDFRLTTALSDAYERIRTDGLSDLSPGGAGSKMLANRWQDHRFLVFKDSQAWLDYQKRFGSSDIFATMSHHLDRMARDTAMMEVLGPNPDAMVRFMADTARKQAAVAGEKDPATKIKLLEDIYALQSGRLNHPVSEPWAARMSGARNLLTSAQLGGAFLSALTDLSYQKLARQFNALPVTNILSGYMRMMNPLNKADRDLAIQLGLVAENATSMALAQRRYLGEVMGPDFTRIIADSVLKVSLLSPWTEAGRHAFGMELLGFLARNADQPFEGLPAKIRSSMSNYGIGAGEWDRIRASDMIEQGGAKFVSPVRMAQQKGMLEIAHKVHQMVLTETEFAVPSIDSRTRAILLQGTKPGTWAGEIMRSVAMYKSFPVTVITTHIMRGLARPTAGKAGAYLADLFISATVLGALAYQAKQLQRGKDPINMDPRNTTGQKFWIAAMQQGGGIGIFGDYLFSDVSRFGASPAMTFAGPMAEFGDNVFKLTLGNARELALGEPTNAGREGIHFASRYMPGGSLWYGRLAFERLVLDQLQMKVDKRARQSFAQSERLMRQQYGQRYWWRPGSTAPSRAPRMNKAIGSNP